MISHRLVHSAAALALLCGAAVAQTPAEDSAAAPRLELSTPQKQTIYQSIAQTQKNAAAPTGFRAAVGAVVPPSVELAPVPATIIDLMPQTKGLEVARVEGQVILVNPTDKQVLSVIAQEP